MVAKPNIQAIIKSLAKLGVSASLTKSRMEMLEALAPAEREEKQALLPCHAQSSHS